MCSDDPFDDGVPNLVINHPVVSTADEELVLMESRKKRERTDILKMIDKYFSECLCSHPEHTAALPRCRCSADSWR